MECLFDGMFDGMADAGARSFIRNGTFDGMFDGMFRELFDGMFRGMFDGVFDGMFDGMPMECSVQALALSYEMDLSTRKSTVQPVLPCSTVPWSMNNLQPGANKLLLIAYGSRK